MPRTVLLQAAASRAGVPLNFTQSDQVGGNAFPNDGSALLVVRNATAQQQNVIFRVPAKMDNDLTVADRVVPVPPNTSLLIGKFAQEVYNQADGNVYVDCSAAMGLISITAA